MRPVIIPAILTSSLEDLKNIFSKLTPHFHYLQIDIADGIFVPNKTISLTEMANYFSFKDLNLDIHLMVAHPKDYFNDCQKLKPKRVFIHFESLGENSLTFFNSKNIPFKIGLAINPKTQIKEFKPIVSFFEDFLFLTVNPGFQGQIFQEKVLEKIKKFKREHPEKTIIVDGGINRENIKKVIQAGANEVVVGSFIVKNPSPKRAHFELMSKI